MNGDGDEKNVACDEDTVSLIDLVAVLLRHRRLILGATAGVLALVLVGAFLYPPLALAKARQNRIVEATMSLMLASNFEGSIGATEGTNFLLQSLYDPSNLLEALRGAGFDTIGTTAIGADADMEKALYTIRRRIVDNKDLNGSPLKESDRVFTVKQEKSAIVLVFMDTDPEKAKALLINLISIVSNDLRTFALPIAEATVESYQRLLEIGNPNETIEASIAQDYKAYKAARNLIDGTLTPITVLRKPYILVEEISIQAIRRDFIKKGALAVFAVFFMTVLLAFVLQYVDAIKKDPESMTKLKDALTKR